MRRLLFAAGAALTERLAGGPTHTARLTSCSYQRQPDGTLATPPLQLRGCPQQVCVLHLLCSPLALACLMTHMSYGCKLTMSCVFCSPNSPLASPESPWPASGFEPMGGAASAWQQNSSMQRQSAPFGAAAQLHAKAATPASERSREPRQSCGSPDTASPMQPDDDQDAGSSTPLMRSVHMHVRRLLPGSKTPDTVHPVLLLGAAFAYPHGNTVSRSAH